MSAELKSLDEHNAERAIFALPDNSPRLNGLACPKCGSELIDSSPMIMLTSNPPQKHINCSKCDYRGTAYT